MARWLSRDLTGNVYRLRYLNKYGDTTGSYGPYATLGAAKAQRTRNNRYRSTPENSVIEMAEVWTILDEDAPLDIDVEHR